MTRACLTILMIGWFGLTVNASVKITFIGNAAISIENDSAVILVDFPYESGAFGYMEYDAKWLASRENSLCLFTHRHKDHFASELIEKVKCSVAGPSEVPAEFSGAGITVIPSSHANTQHSSYKIEWDGVKIFVSGDTENPKNLDFAKDADLLFITPWLFRAYEKETGQIPPTKKIVFYHHTADETLPSCSRCESLKQGESITMNSIR